MPQSSHSAVSGPAAVADDLNDLAHSKIEYTNVGRGQGALLRGEKEVWDSLYRVGKTRSWREHVRALDEDVGI